MAAPLPSPVRAPAFSSVVSSEAELRQLYREPTKLVKGKKVQRLDDVTRASFGTDDVAAIYPGVPAPHAVLALGRNSNRGQGHAGDHPSTFIRHPANFNIYPSFSIQHSAFSIAL